jgi:hypothetical protein
MKFSVLQGRNPYTSWCNVNVIYLYIFPIFNHRKAFLQLFSYSVCYNFKSPNSVLKASKSCVCSFLNFKNFHQTLLQSPPFLSVNQFWQRGFILPASDFNVPFRRFSFFWPKRIICDLIHILCIFSLKLLEKKTNGDTNLVVKPLLFQ